MLLSWPGRILRNIKFNPRRHRQPGTRRAEEKEKKDDTVRNTQWPASQRLPRPATARRVGQEDFPPTPVGVFRREHKTRGFFLTGFLPRDPETGQPARKGVVRCFFSLSPDLIYRYPGQTSRRAVLRRRLLFALNKKGAGLPLGLMTTKGNVRCWLQAAVSGGCQLRPLLP